VSEVKHVERRKTKVLDDPYPPDQFVPWHRWLVVSDLHPGQWSISPQGEVFRRLSVDGFAESKKSVLQ